MHVRVSGACCLASNEELSASRRLNKCTVGLIFTVCSGSKERVSFNNLEVLFHCDRERLTGGERILYPIPGEKVFLSALVIFLDIIDL